MRNPKEWRSRWSVRITNLLFLLMISYERQGD